MDGDLTIQWESENTKIKARIERRIAKHWKRAKVIKKRLKRLFFLL